MTDESRETFDFPIEVTLTPEEVEERLERNADIDRKMIDIKNQKAEANSGFNEDLKILRKEQVTLLEMISVGKAKVEVQCYHERDDRRGIMLTMRCDNGHIVDERALTADERGAVEDERQGNLFDGGAGGPGTDLSEDEEPAGDADSESALDEYLAQAGASAVGDNDDAGEEGALAH